MTTTHTATTHTATTHTATADPDTSTSEWEVETLDLGAYLNRIGYHGEITPTVDTLRGLRRAHGAAIGFDNLDVVLGRGISVEMPGLVDKLITRGRGGYCYEHNLLFGAALERAGFEVRRLLGRVTHGRRPAPRTHLTLLVRAQGSSWLADVGFGAHALDPVEITDGATVSPGGWTYRIERADEWEWALRWRTPDGFAELYRFTEAPQHHGDIVMANHFTSTHPGSPFYGNLIAMRAEPDVRYLLRGHELRVERPDGSATSHTLAPGEVPEVLRDTFGTELDTTDRTELREFLEQ